MHTAFRRSITAGVTLATVGAIALVPTAARPQASPLPERRVVTAEVTPAAFFDPGYGALLADGVAGSLADSLQALTTSSPALLQEALANWPLAETELAYSQIANAFVVPLMPLVAGPFTDAVTEVLARSAPQFRDQIETLPTFIEHSTIRLLGPVLGAIGGAGAAHAEIYWATATGDIPGFVLGVLKVPVYVADGFLFGGYGDVGPLLSGSDGRVIPAPGLFTPWNSDLLDPPDPTPSDDDEPTTTTASTLPAPDDEDDDKDKDEDNDEDKDKDEDKDQDTADRGAWRWGPTRDVAEQVDLVNAEIEESSSDFRSVIGGEPKPATEPVTDGEAAADEPATDADPKADTAESAEPTTSEPNAVSGEAVPD
ncbi:MAG: hypothetical protein ABWY45_19740 [Mycobacterium sp.]